MSKMLKNVYLYIFSIDNRAQKDIQEVRHFLDNLGRSSDITPTYM